MKRGNTIVTLYVAIFGFLSMAWFHSATSLQWLALTISVVTANWTKFVRFRREPDSRYRGLLRIDG